MLSVLIVNWNTRDLLRKCLLSLRQFPPHQPCEVIVVDNASSDGSADMVKAEFKEVTLIAEATNTGYARGNNLAFAAASGTWLLTLNPDTEVFEDTLESAVEVLERLPQHGALGAQLVGVDNQVQASVRGFPGVLGILGDLTGLGARLPKSKLNSYRLLGFDYGKEQDADQPMGTFLLFRREALDSVGDSKNPFDESFPIFFNEVDLLYRLRKTGWLCRYAPQVKVRHVGAAGTRQVRKNMIWESHKSLVRFFRKHHRTAWNALFISLLAGIVYVGAWVRARGYHAGFRA